MQDYKVARLQDYNRIISGVKMDGNGTSDWIDITDRLPSDREEVLVYNPRGPGRQVVKFWSQSWLTEDAWYFPERDSSIDVASCSITHWAKLPNPPSVDPLSTVDLSRINFENTDCYRLFWTNSDISVRLNNALWHGFLRQWTTGFDGSLNHLTEIAEGDRRIWHIGKKYRQVIKQVIETNKGNE